MSLFPFNTNVTQQAQSDVDHIKTRLLHIVRYDQDAAAMVVADVDWFVASVDMKVGDYTMAHTTMPGTITCARNVTVKVVTVDGADTMGTVLVTGTDLADAALTETITPVSGATVQGTKAFKTVTSVTGAGWVTNGGEDTIEVGFGDLIGLPDKLTHNTVVFAVFNNVKEATAPTVTVSSTVLSLNTVDLNSALNGSLVSLYYLPI